jgi:hypothetical protein
VKHLALLILAASQTFATTFYVKNGGNNSLNGQSDANAWETVAKVNASSFNPDDQILFKRGSVWHEQLYVPSSGTSGHPVIFGAYGTGARPIITAMNDISGSWTYASGNIWHKSISHWPGRVYLSGTEAHLAQVVGDLSSTYRWYSDGSTLYVYSSGDPSGTVVESNGITNGAVRVYQADYVTLKSLDIRGSDPCVDVDGSAHLIIDSCAVLWGAAGIGIECHNSGSNYGEIKNSTLDFGTHDYDPVSTRYFYYGGRTNFGDAICNNIDFGASGINVHDWDVHDNYIAGAGHAIIELDNASNILVHDNELVGGYKPIDAHDNTSNSEFYRNFIHRCWIRNQVAGSYNKFYYNIIDSIGLTWPYTYESYGRCDQLAGFGFWSSTCNHNQVINNTVTNTGGPGLGMEAGSGIQYNTVQNNLFFNCGTIVTAYWQGNWYAQNGTRYVGIATRGDPSQGDQTGHPNYFRNNLVYYGGQNGYAYRTDWNWYASVTRHSASQFNGDGISGDTTTGNLDGNPQLASDYTIPSGSPAEAAGLAIAIGGQWDGKDYFGNVVGANPSIGASEVAGTPSPSDTLATVVTGTKSSVTASTVTLHGTIDANSTDADGYFLYGLTTAYGDSMPCVEGTITGTTATAVSAALTGLSASSTYHYRLSASNAAGYVRAAYDSTFTTSAGAPTIGRSTSLGFDFGSVGAGYHSASQNLGVDGHYLTGNITISAPTQFELSVDDISFSSTIVLVPTSGTVSSTTVYARFSPIVPGPRSDNITYTSPGATTKYTAVTGVGTGGGTPSAGYMWNIVNSGALMNGSDDRGSIQKAIDSATVFSGGTIWFPSGTTWISSPIILSPNDTLRGAGQNLSIIKARSDFSGYSMIYFTSPCTGAAIKQLRIDGNRQGQSHHKGHMLLSTYGSNGMRTVDHFSIDSCDLRNSSDFAVGLQNGGAHTPTYVTISNSYFYSNGDTVNAGGVFTSSNSAHITIRGNTFDSTWQHAVYMNADTVTISDNLMRWNGLRDGGGEALTFRGNDAFIDSNVVYGSQAEGITVQKASGDWPSKCHRVRLKGNLVSNNLNQGKYGPTLAQIYVDHTDSCTIENNVVGIAAGSTVYGIRVSTSNSRLIIRSNSILVDGTAGISLRDTVATALLSCNSISPSSTTLTTGIDVTSSYIGNAVGSNVHIQTNTIAGVITGLSIASGTSITGLDSLDNLITGYSTRVYDPDHLLGVSSIPISCTSVPSATQIRRSVLMRMSR